MERVVRDHTWFRQSDKCRLGSDTTEFPRGQWKTYGLLVVMRHLIADEAIRAGAQSSGNTSRRVGMRPHSIFHTLEGLPLLLSVHDILRGVKHVKPFQTRKCNFSAKP